MKDISLRNERILILTGKKTHAILANNLRNRGAYVILVDANEQSLAKPFVDEHILADPFDVDIVERIVLDKHPTRIMVIAMEKSFKVASLVSEKLGLPFPYTHDQILSFTEKDMMKSLFLSNGINTSEYHIVHSLDNLPSIQFPAIVKPVDSSGSRGITKIVHESELANALQYAMDFSSKKEAIIEQFISGDEYQAECFVQDGKTHVLMVKQKLKFIKDVVSSQVGSLTIPVSSGEEYSLYESVAAQISKAFGITRGNFFFQAIMSSGKLYVLEIGVRLGGGWGYKIISEVAGFDLPVAAMSAQLGIKISMDYHHPRKFYLTNFLFSKACVLKEITGLDRLKEAGIIDDYQVNKKSGTVIDGKLANTNRLGIYLISADNKCELFNKMQSAINNIDILGVDGLSYLDRSMYLNFLKSI